MRTEPLRRLLCRLLCLAAALVGVGCSSIHYPLNVPLAPSGEREDGYALRRLAATGNSDGLLLIAAFSGGGYRAAAMAFAVMEELHETAIAWDGQRRTLLQGSGRCAPGSVPSCALRRRPRFQWRCTRRKPRATLPGPSSRR